jgi:hypothetical protein
MFLYSFVMKGKACLIIRVSSLVGRRPFSEIRITRTTVLKMSERRSQVYCDINEIYNHMNFEICNRFLEAESTS